MRYASSLSAVDEGEALSKRLHASTVSGIHPRGTVPLPGDKTGTLDQLLERQVIVAHGHLTPAHCLHGDFLQSPCPHNFRLETRRARSDDRVTLPRVVGPTRKQHPTDRPFTICPKKLLDAVRAAWLAPPPLHIRGFPDTCLPVGSTSAPEQLCGQHQRVTPGRSDLPYRHFLLLQLLSSIPLYQLLA